MQQIISKLGIDVNRFRDKHYLMLFVLFIIAFTVPRFFYFIYIPLPGIDSDSLTYWIAAYQMEIGEMPLFNIRTPLYPIYMYFMRSITDGAMTGIAIQMIATFFVHLFLLNSVYKYFKRLFIPLGIIVSSMVFLDFSIRFDTNYLGEVFYINGVVLYFTLILRAIFNEDKSLKFWMFSSIVIGVILLARPAGMFLIPAQIIISIFLFIRKEGWKVIISTLAPMFLIIFSLCFYNLKSVGKFTVSPWGQMNLIGCVLGFIEPKAHYSEFTNNNINQIRSAQVNQEYETIRDTWDIEKLHDAFKFAYHLNGQFTMAYMPDGKIPEHLDIIFNEFSILSKEAIAENKLLYTKFFYMSFVKHLEYFAQQNYGFFSGITDLYAHWLLITPDKVFNQGLISNGEISQEVKQYALANYYNNMPFDYDLKSKDLKNNFFFKLYDWINFKVLTPLMKNMFWIALFFLCWIISIFNFFKSKLKDNIWAFIACFGMIYIGANITASLVEVPVKRYMVPVEFFIYFVVILSIGKLIFKQNLLQPIGKNVKEI